MTDPARTIPILASLDIAESRAFYTGKLGFSTVYADADYLIVRRGEMELHFWKTDDRRFPEHTACYIRGGEVEDLYAEYRTASLDHLSDFAVRPWGMKEFTIHDPHGNLLRFGLRVDPAPPAGA